MAVVINEFEVVPGEAPTRKPDEGVSSQGGGGGSADKPSEQEIERIVEHQMARAERVWAY
jgi:hypothetical protein